MSLLDQATALQAQGDEQNAYRVLVAAVSHEPTNPAAWYRLGQTLMGMSRWAAAAACFRRANALYPNDAATLTNLGWMLHKSGRHSEAADVLVSAIEADPSLALPNTNLAQVLITQRFGVMAFSKSSRAIELSDEPIHRMSHAFALFANGLLKTAFREYEARIPYRLPEYAKYPYPRWDGGSVTTLYIQAEQGIGDTLMMLRYLGEAAIRCNTIVLFVHKELRRLVQDVVGGHSLFVDADGDESDGTWPCRIEVGGMPAALPQADAFCPIMSLPLALDVDDFSMHARPYIATDVHGLEKNPSMDPARADMYRIGLCWAGSAEHDHDEHRSLHLREFMPFIDRLDTKIRTLQLGAPQKQIAELGLYGVIEDCSGRLTDMADTRDLIADLDLVLTCDTSVAHLAGAMGKPTWLFLNQRGIDWRWTSDHVWYPSIRIFKRELGEQWSDPIGRAVTCLESLS